MPNFSKKFCPLAGRAAQAALSFAPCASGAFPPAISLCPRPLQKNSAERIVFFTRACYNGGMTIRKSAGCALAATLLLGTVCAIPPQTTDAQAAVTAQSEPAVLTRENASLFLPESYEQYLSLQTPTDVAFTEDYIAIADGSYI